MSMALTSARGLAAGTNVRGVVRVQLCSAISMYMSIHGVLSGRASVRVECIGTLGQLLLTHGLTGAFHGLSCSSG